MQRSSDKAATPARRMALRFEQREDLLNALEALDELELVYPIQYAIVPGTLAVVVPTRSFAKVASLMREREIAFSESKVVPLNLLSPEEQAKRRGYLRKRSS